MSIAFPSSVKILDMRLNWQGNHITHEPAYGGNRRVLRIAAPRLRGEIRIANRDKRSKNHELLRLLACMEDPGQVFEIPHNFSTSATDAQAAIAIQVSGAPKRLTMTSSQIATRFGGDGSYIVKATRASSTTTNRMMLVTVLSNVAYIQPEVGIDFTGGLLLAIRTTIPAFIEGVDQVIYHHTPAIAQDIQIRFQEALNQ